MYLVSIYFDEKTNQRIRSMIKQVAEKSGNTFMIDGNVPPHITVSAFETLDEKAAVDTLEHVVKEMRCGELQWASVGQFFPYVIYTAPVLNEYLHDMSVKVYNGLNSLDSVKISPYYRPFQWLPHTTIGKKLSKEEMQIAFEVLQNSFGMFSGRVERIGLAKTNPYREVVNWKLM